MDIEIVLNGEDDSLEFLKAVYRNPEVPLFTRMKAAGIAIEYERPKLAATMIVNGGDFAAKLDRAIARSQSVNQIEAKPKVISEKLISDEIEEIPIKPILTVPDKRYRR
jgi:hypothetical protein